MRPPLPLGAHGEIMLRKKGSGKWVARAYYRDQTGKRREATASAKTKAAAHNALQAKLQQPDTSALTLSSYTAKWFELYQGQVSANTARITRFTITNQIDPHGAIRLHEITVPWADSLIQAAATPVERRRADGQPYIVGGHSTAMRLRTTLKMVLDEAVREGHLSSNPIPLTRPVKKPKPTPKAMTRAQLTELRDQAREYYRANPTYSSAHYVPDLIDTLIGTGMRVGEALALRWEDLDGNQLRIHATMIITGAGGQIYQPHTKTKQERVVTLPPWLMEVLQARGRDGRFIFGGESMAAYKGFVSHFKKIVAGELSWVTPKTIRASVATLLEREVGLEAAALQLGHEGTAVTARSYVERRGVADFSNLL